jgi:hypothetical protein
MPAERKTGRFWRDGQKIINVYKDVDCEKTAVNVLPNRKKVLSSISF